MLDRMDRMQKQSVDPAWKVCNRPSHWSRRSYQAMTPEAADDPRSFLPPLNTASLRNSPGQRGRASRLDWFRSETVRDRGHPKAGQQPIGGPTEPAVGRPPGDERRKT